MRIRLELLGTSDSGGPGTSDGPAASGTGESALAATGNDHRAIDVVVEAEPGTPLSAVRGELCRLAGWAGDMPLGTSGVPLRDEHPLGVPPLLQGTRLEPLIPLSSGSATPPLNPAEPIADVAVIAGPGAGRTISLTDRSIVVGRSRSADLPVPDDTMSRRHLCLEPHPQGIRVRDLGSSNGTAVIDQSPRALTSSSLDAWAVTEAGVDVPAEAVIGAGATMLAVRRRAAQALICRPTGRGTLGVGRRPRPAPSTPDPDTDLPDAPTPPSAARLNVLVIVLPLVICVSAALLLNNPVFLLFGLLSPVLSLSQWLGDRRARQREHRRAMAAHRECLARLEADLARRTRRELHERRRRQPDLALVLSVAQHRLDRLWERCPTHDDSLTVRLGIGSIRARCHVRAKGTARHPLLPDAPVTLDLRQHPCVGISGEHRSAGAVLGGIIGQLATWNSPRDLDIVVLASGPVRLAGWRWAQLLPHTADPRDGARVFDLESTEADEQQAMSRTLRDLVDLDGRRSATGTHMTLLVIDGCRGVREMPQLNALLSGHARLRVLCLGRTPADLPVDCTVTIKVDGSQARLTRAGAASSHTRNSPRTAADTAVAEAFGDAATPATFIPDLPDQQWRHDLGRALAPLRDLSAGTDPAVTLPHAVHLDDLLGVNPRDVEAIDRAWQARGGTTRTPVGVGPSGTYELDLHRDGPHLLVAGMTGSGKSEFLRTLITGLAVRNRPDRLGFVLIDYKGGSAFDGCARLPHVLGMATDLDGSLATRALVSLRVELRRRERLLRSAGVETLDAYEMARTRDPDLVALPRLVVVVDEFRALAEEHPLFVPGLIRVATQGRSLGMHLVLATQRPAGVVSAEIRANTNLRIALRVRDPIDSHDVIDTDAAAQLPAGIAGRALLRTGGGPVVPVQVARCAGPRAGAAAPPRVHRIGAAPARKGPTATTSQTDRTRTPRAGSAPTSPPAEVAAALTEAAIRHGWCPPTNGAGDRRSLHRPWLPPLPTVVDLGRDVAPPDRAHPTSATGATSCTHAPTSSLTYGLADDPEHQAQPAAAWAIQGHLAIVGASRSGRTTTLLTLARSADATACPGQLHIYVVDAGNGLAGLAALAHVGAVVGIDDGVRLRALMARLVRELRERERHGPSARRPRLILLVDGWERTRESLEEMERGIPAGDLDDLLRQGPSAGIHVVATGGRSLLTGNAARHFAEKVLLRLDDPADAMLAGLSNDHVTSAAHWPPGRGRHLPSRLETQVVVTSLAWPEGMARAVTTASCTPTPFVVAALPTTVSLPEVTTTALALGRDRDESPTTVWLGQGFDGPVSMDLAAGALICGPRGSGRTSTLVTLAAGLSRRRVPWLAYGVPASLLQGLPGGSIVPAAPAAETDALLRALQDAAAGTIVLIDDIERLLDTPAEDVLIRLAQPHTATRLRIVAAGTSADLAGRFRGLANVLRAQHVGIVLQAGPADRELFGAPLPEIANTRHGARTLGVAGRAVVVGSHSTQIVQVARVSPGPARLHRANANRDIDGGQRVSSGAPAGC